MLTEGTISRLFLEKGFGFIRYAGGTDAFFHISDLAGMVFNDELMDRQVKFELRNSSRGPRAQNVRPV